MISDDANASTKRERMDFFVDYRFFLPPLFAPEVLEKMACLGFLPKIFAESEK
jgi:hypothetical protein